MKTIAFTGHRPPKCGLTYDMNSAADKIYLNFIQNLLNDEVEKIGDIKVITGGATGIDQMALVATINVNGYTRKFNLKQRTIDSYYIQSVIAEPFIGFNNIWPKYSIERYEGWKKRSGAEIVVVCEPGVKFSKYQVRDEWMVDHCDELWAFYDGTKGGTRNTVEYAFKVGKPIRNIYNEYNTIQRATKCQSL